MATPLRTEQDWARQHPVPESTEEGMLLSLWNYPVAKSDLAPKHRAALDWFLSVELLGSGSTGRSKTEIYLTGHASDTGDDAANEMLSRQRAGFYHNIRSRKDRHAAILDYFRDTREGVFGNNRAVGYQP